MELIIAMMEKNFANQKNVTYIGEVIQTELVMNLIELKFGVIPKLKNLLKLLKWVDIQILFLIMIIVNKVIKNVE